MHHIDVILYYLQKEFKHQLGNQYKYIIINYLFRLYINTAHAKYYTSQINDDANTQEDMSSTAIVTGHDTSIINVIKRHSIPAALPCHLVDEVYVPISSDSEYHRI